jgi:hypothetical protein
MDNVFEYLNIKNLDDYKKALKLGSSLLTDDKIYHYTNLESLKNILETKSLWATNCEYLNDLLELETFKKEFDQIFDSNDASIRKYVETIITDNLVKLKKLTYIISFASDNDSIAMWRYYGKNGIVLEFDTSVMTNIAERNSIVIINKNSKNIKLSSSNIFGYAIYDNLVIKDLFDFLFKTARNEYQAASNDKKENVSFENQYETTMALYRVYFFKKDTNFRFEKEFRMVFTVNEEDVGKIEKFRIKNNMYIPYIDIKFEKNGYLPLKSITINPEQQDQMYEDGLKRLLLSYNYNIPIYHSKSKIR